MSEKFNNKYRIESARLQKWNYSWAAAYFITICTHKNQHYFGEIIDGKMQLSEIGKIAYNEWIKSFKIRPDMNLKMGEFVVMPDHFHAIICIGKNDYNTHNSNQNPDSTDAMHCVSSSQNKFGPQSKNLGSIVRGFKSAVTTGARKIQPNFKWHPRFHDSIIGDTESYNRITSYIIQNPSKWQNNKLNK